jgi:hypothetical protein
MTTSKNKECLVCVNNIYYLKRTNKDSSTNWVCSRCTASITIKDSRVIKVNGNEKFVYTGDQSIIDSHRDHQPLTDEELLVKDTIEVIKKRVKNETVPVRQIYQEEQTNVEDVFTNLYDEKPIDEYDSIDIELKWHHIETGDLKSKGRNIEDVERDLHIQKLKCEYLMNKLDILEYVDQVSDVILNFSKKNYKKNQK